jgi:D-alanine-D-alanine ligase
MPRDKLTIALLAGGKSAEREVSLKSGEQVYQALDKERYDVVRYDPRDDLPKLVGDAAGIDVAVIILHGRFGEDGVIQGFLESLGIPYQGSGVLGSAMAMSKIVSKRLYEKAGLPVAPYAVMDRMKPEDGGAVLDRLGLPVVVKPEHEGSSIGLTIVREPDELNPALEKAWRFDRCCLVERYVEGVEVTAGVLGNDDVEALPLIEIIPGEGYEFFDYEAKYVAGATREICPARIPDETTARIQDLAVRAHEALYCRGYSRTDTIMSSTGEVFVLETNTLPGMTRTSLFPQSAAKGGYEFPQLMDRLIELALEDRKRE